MKGVIGFLDNNIKASNGNITNDVRLTSSEVAGDTEVDLQCVGDCIDYTIENVTTPSVSVVIPLAAGIPNDAVWRSLDGTWTNFDTSTGDTHSIGSVFSGRYGMSETLVTPPTESSRLVTSAFNSRLPIMALMTQMRILALSVILQVWRQAVVPAEELSFKTIEARIAVAAVLQ